MACFTVTTVAAIGVGVARHIVKHKEKKADPTKLEPVKLDNWSTSKKLGILELALFGGSFILAGEHIIHGEVSFKFPWLTAFSEGSDAVKGMLFEMGTVGVSMMLAIVGAWAVGLVIRHFILKRRAKQVDLAGQ